MVLQTDGEKDRKIFRKKSSLDIKEGDIVLVRKNQVVQFNMLILIFSKNDLRQRQCSISTYFIDEKTYIQKKNYIDKLQPKENIQTVEQFRKYALSLNFKIEICTQTKNGILKVTKDPKPEEISISNIILDNSEIKSDWVLGIKISNQDQYIKKLYFKNFKKTKAEMKSKLLLGLFYVLVLFVLFVNYTIQININYQKFNFLRSILQSTILLSTIDFNLWQQILEFIYLKFIKKQMYQQYKQQIENQKSKRLLPLCTFAKNEAVNAKIKLKKSQTQKPFKRKNKIKNQQAREIEKIKKFQIINNRTFQNLSNIGTVVMSQNGLICGRQFEVKSVAYVNNYYSINYIEESQQKQQKNCSNQKLKEKYDRMCQSQVKNQKIQIMASFKDLDSSPTQVAIDEKSYQFMTKNELKVFKDISNSIVIKKDKNIKNFLLNFCNFFNLQEFYLNKQNNIQTTCPLDTCLLKFFKNFELEIQQLFINSDRDLCLQYKQMQKNQVKVILHIDNCLLTDKIRIMYKDDMNDRIFVLLRTSDQDFVQNSLRESQRYISQIQFQNKKNNLQSQFLYRYQFDQEESDTIHQQIQNYKLKGQETYHLLKQKIDEIEDSLQFFGAIGLKETPKVDEELINSFLKANFRICILSQNQNYLWKIFLDKLNLPFQLIKLNLEFEDSIQGKTYFQDIFQKYDVAFNSIVNNTVTNDQKMKLFFQQKTQIHFDRKFILSINQKTFDVILKDPFLFYNFNFIVYYSIYISCIGLNSEQKSLVVQLLQKLEKEKTVLAIGEGIKDFYMMNQADTSVQQKSQNIFKAGDIIVQNWDSLKQFIFCYVQSFQKKLIFIQLNITQNIFFFIIQVQIENLQHKTGKDFIPSSSILIFIVLQIGVSTLVLLKKYEQDVLDQNYIVYNIIFCQNFILKYNFGLFVIEALFESLLIYFIIAFSLDGVFFQDKQYTQKEVYFLIMFISTIFLILRNFIMLPMKSSQKVIIVFIQFFIMYFVFEFDNFGIKSKIYFRLFSDKKILVIMLVALTFGFFVVFMAYIALKAINNIQENSIQNTKNNKFSVVSFLHKWYKVMGKKEFVQTLFQIHKFKQFIDLYLLNQIYPVEKLDNPNFLSQKLLQIQIPYMDKNFYQSFYLKNLKRYFVVIIIIFFFNSFLLLLDQIYKEFLFAEMFFLPTIFLNLCCIFIFYYTYKNVHYLRYFEVMLLLSEIVSRLIFLNIGQYFALLEIAQLLLKSQIQLSSIKVNIVMNFFRLLTFVCYIAKIQKLTDNLIIQIFLVFFYTIIVIFNFLNVFNQQKVAKKNLIMKHILKKKKNYNTDLLTFLMPSFIINQLQYDMNDNYFASDAGEVSVMFLYITGFDKILDYFKDDIITVLDTLYKDFDILCEKFGVQKIESVGNSYVAACGGQVGEQQISQYLKQQEPTKRVFDLALAIMQIIEQHNKLRNFCFQLQIGINTGKCMMGVIGYHKPQFSLIGDTINTTSRVCTTGKKDRIMISQESFDILKKYNLDPKYKIETVNTYMKGKGKQNVFHVYQKPKIQNYIKKALLKLKKGNILDNQQTVENKQSNEMQEKLVELDRKQSTKKFIKRRTSKLMTIKALKNQGSFFVDKTKIKPIKSLKFNSLATKNTFASDKLQKKKTLGEYELYLEKYSELGLFNFKQYRQDIQKFINHLNKKYSLFNKTFLITVNVIQFANFLVLRQCSEFENVVFVYFKVALSFLFLCLILIHRFMQDKFSSILFILIILMQILLCQLQKIYHDEQVLQAYLIFIERITICIFCQFSTFFKKTHQQQTMLCSNIAEYFYVVSIFGFIFEQGFA